ncbi:MAG: transposase [Deltaproteobacteria bacterium]|nr:transposase [Deltaproteobacteria bacterium]
MVPRTRLSYEPEFRRQMVELTRAGRGAEQVAREFEPTTAQAIRNWVCQAHLVERRFTGPGHDRLW